MFGIKSKIRNFIKYIKTGGQYDGPPVVRVNLSFISPSERFKGKKVLVTGGSSGIGYEIAKEFISEGAEVLITGRNSTKLKEAEKRISSNSLHIMEWDIADISLLKNNFEKVIQLLGGVDIFINNAGVCEIGAWSKFDEESYDNQCDINAKSLFFTCQEEAKYLINNKKTGAKIINITSIAGIKSAMDPYSISKWGAACITKGLSKELAPYGISVNGIAPGNVVTSIHKGYDGEDISKNAYCAAHPTGRYTLVEEIASLAKFLADDCSSNIVGQIIAVDGGRTTI